MILSLSIRDVVLIDKLDLSFEDNLSVLTGETGAGKSILLDALGLALGARADSGLVRSGAKQASVTAEFSVGADHPAQLLLDEADIPRDDVLLLRRTVNADGRSRAFFNDQPVSASFLKRVGETLVEIQGQFDQHRLMEPGVHLDLLDGFAGLRGKTREVGAAYDNWRQAEHALNNARERQQKAREEEDYLRHALEELETLAPEPDEESRLNQRRTVLMNAEQVMDAINTALDALSGENGAEMAIAQAQKAMDRVEQKSGSIGSRAAEPLDRAAAEVQEALSALAATSADIEAKPGELEETEDRLHAMRQLARKHNVGPDDLIAVRDDIADKLSQLDEDGGTLAELSKAAGDARAAYLALAKALSKARKAAAKDLDAALMAELPPLKLEKAQFRTGLTELEEHGWGPHGLETATFEVSTNPGAPFGSLRKIASGGELSRFLLGLKVVLAAADPIPTLVFDEVDAGVGGAVAAAVGERLAKLGESLQILVVTHSPQVASLGEAHMRVEKYTDRDLTFTKVRPLEASERREEIARMLSGAEVTDEARAAADSLLARQAAQ